MTSVFREGVLTGNRTEMREHMAGTLQDTPSGERLHIGVFGRTNSGKSSFLNAFTGQKVSITSDVAGTTTDPVYKAMEVHPVGPCIFMDTAGFDDETRLGERRMEKTRLAAEKTELAVIVVCGQCAPADFSPERELSWYRYFKKRKVPVLFVVSRADLGCGAQELAAELEKVSVKAPEIPYLCNVEADYVTDSAPIKGLLARQVSSTVRWRETMERMLADGVDTFIEIGPGRTLAGFLKKMSRDAKVLNVAKVEDVDAVTAFFGQEA